MDLPRPALGCSAPFRLTTPRALSHSPPVRSYLDHNATTPLGAAAAHAMSGWLSTGRVANASSAHAQGRAARSAIETARRQVAAAVGAPDPRQILFVGGATEANNQVLASFPDRLVTSTVEHPSVLEPARRRSDTTLLPVDGAGRVRLGALERALGDGARLCSIIGANNETGVLQDLPAIAARCEAHGTPLHVDCAQMLGRVTMDLSRLGADLATFSAHKVHGPVGVGALWARRPEHLRRLVHGGHQERGLRPGTESVASIVGFGAAAAEIPRLLEAAAQVEARRDALWEGLAALGAVQWVGQGAPMLPNTLCVSFDGLEAEALLMAFDLGGVSVSAGSACTAGSLEPSHVLEAMGLPESVARAAVRFSLGVGTAADEIAHALRVANESVPRIREAA